MTTMNVAMLLSCDSFELFYERVLRLDFERYLSTYRNDWSWDHARGLLANGLRPTLYLPSLNHSGRHETETGVAVRFLKLADWYRPVERLRRACRATRWSLYAQEQANAAAFRRSLDAALREDAVDVLYVQEYWGGRFDYLARHVTVPLTGVDQGGLAGGTVTAFKRASFARAAALYAQTRDECDVVAAHGGRATLQPNGCDTDYFRPPPPDAPHRAKTLLTVARLTDKQKRTSDLIRAMAMLGDDWSLDVIGDGPDRAWLGALAAEVGVAGRVRFHGFRTRAEVRDALHRCGVYAMPSSNEGVCLALLEAMACEASVVGTRIRTFETMVEDGVSGRLVPVGDPAALAGAIDDAWARREAFGRAAVAAVAERFDSRVLYRRLADSLRAAAGRGPTSGMAEACVATATA